MNGAWSLVHDGLRRASPARLLLGDSIGQLANTLVKVGVPLLSVREYLLQYIVGSEREVLEWGQFFGKVGKHDFKKKKKGLYSIHGLPWWLRW